MNTELTLAPQFNPQSETRQKLIKESWNKGKLMGQKPPLKLGNPHTAATWQASTVLKSMMPLRWWNKRKFNLAPKVSVVI